MLLTNMYVINYLFLIISFLIFAKVQKVYQLFVLR